MMRGLYENTVPVSLRVLIGMGSKVCSKNSKMCGLIVVSSGTLCSVIQANKDAFFTPFFLPQTFPPK